MAVYEWKKEFTTFLDDIDAQHKIFLSYINQCHNAITKNKQTGIPPDLIRRLKKYAEIHFSYEEQMMEFHGFPELAKQKAMHKQFTDDILKLEKALLAGESTTTLMGVLGMMRDWFINHIIEEDRKLGRYL